MEHPCVRLGKEKPAGAAFAASGSSSMLDFLSSPLLSNAGVLNSVTLGDDELLLSAPGVEGFLEFSAKGVRNREEAREAGSFVRFLRDLPLLSCWELVISRVELASLDELSALCSAIGSPSCTIRELKLDYITLPSAEDSVSSSADLAETLVKDALLNNTSLTSFTLSTSDAWHLDCIIPALIHTPCSIKKVCLSLGSSRTLEDASGILTGLADNTISLTSLSICGSYCQNDSHQIHLAMGTLLLGNTSLESLNLNGWHLPGQVVRKLFASLEQNAHVTSLSLLACEGSDWPSASFVLNCLRANGILHNLFVQLTPLEGDNEAAIQAQLRRNKEKVAQVKVLQEAGSARVQPTTVRLFLCGLPHSGKTTLSRSLVRWNSSTSHSTKCLLRTRKSIPHRTRGIELSTIKNDRIRVSLWDMAGQAEYYAFHDHMFPNLSNDETPSLFLFVWSPIQVDKLTGQEIKDECGEFMVKKPQEFEQEFRYWLRFIASKTLPSYKFNPKLLVAITRLDLLKINMKAWIKESFKQCQEDFKEHIEFDMEGVFELDARDSCKIEDLALYIFERSKLLLDLRSHVYQACNLARVSIPTKASAPLITKQEFSFLCKKHLGLDSKEMHEAVALSLNASGDLIFFKSFDLVVVDTQWFCHHLMGDLLHFGKNRYQHKGFFSLEILEGLLEESTKRSTTIHGKRFKAIRTIFGKAANTSRIKGKDLVKLLVGLQLACWRNDGEVNFDIFIPASLSAIPKEPVDPCKYLKGDDENIMIFMGRRLRCKDSKCTFLTPAIFSLLQVTFDNIYKELHITLEEDIIFFLHNGVKVLVEFCKHEGQDHFIDVLIHSRLDLDSTIGWAHEEILERIKNVCAQPRGIQGVQLVCEVIRPRSVRELVRMEERIDAAVSIDELSKTLIHFLEKRGVQLESLQSVFHDWHSTKDSDCVTDLLGNVETLKVIKEYQQKFILDVEDVLEIDVEQEVCSEVEPEKKLFSSTTSGKEREWIYDEVRGARKDIYEVHKEVHKLAEDEQKLCRAVLPEVLQKLKELLTFSKENEVGKLPRLFVVTRNDAGLGRRLVSAMVPRLQNVRLELLCEHRIRPHLVAEQRGITFATLEDGLLKQGLPYIHLFLRLVRLVVKVGAHVAGGLGDTVPDFSHLLALAVDAREFPSFPTCLDMQAPGPSRTNSRVNFQESQRWLWNVLSKHNCCTSIRIHEVFGLNRVQYHGSHVGWLCDNHCSEGALCPI